MKTAQAPAVFVNHSEEMEMLRWTIHKASHLFVELEAKAAENGKLPSVAPLRIMLQAQSRLTAFKKEAAQWDANAPQAAPSPALPVIQATAAAETALALDSSAIATNKSLETANKQTVTQDETPQPESLFPAYLPELIAQHPRETLIQEIAKHQDPNLSHTERLLQARKVLTHYQMHHPPGR